MSHLPKKKKSKAARRLLRLQTTRALSHPELVLGAPVQVLDGARELLAVVARLEAISLRHKTRQREGKTVSERASERPAGRKKYFIGK